MGRNSKTKQLERYLIRKVVMLEDNMRQWAEADVYLGLEKSHRLEQVMALKENNQDRVVELHDQRLHCLRQALAILSLCPACERHDEPAQEKPDDNDQT